MRLMMMVLCAASVLAQQKQTSGPKPTRYFKLAPIGQPQPKKPAEIMSELRDLVAQAKREASFATAKITLAPGQPCSNPLLKVAPKNTGDRMQIPSSAVPVLDHMPIVKVPAPSCDDVKE